MRRYIRGVWLLLCLSTFVISCGDKTNDLEGYEWLEGKWTLSDDWTMTQLRLNITPSYIQIFRKESEQGPLAVVFSMPKKQPYTIGIAHHYGTDSDLLAICTEGGEDGPNPIAFIDVEEKCLYDFYDFSERMDYKKEVKEQRTETSKKDKVVKRKKQEKEKETSSKAKIKGSQKLFAKAFAEQDALVFNTGFNRTGSQIYLVLHPFVFSQDKMEGKAFFISFEVDTYYKVYRMRVEYYGDYQIIGDYFRFSNAFYYGTKGDEPIFDRIYTITEDSSGSIQLRGKFPRQKKDARMVQTHLPSDQLRAIDNYLDDGFSCMYK